jgi:tRNA threonylcarbamoyladenosine biosynthesis protein TsaB
MNILALDTSMGACSAAVLRADDAALSLHAREALMARGHATGAKLYGTDSLTVMARTALASGLLPNGPFAVAVDARRGMLYLGLYDQAGARREGPLLISPDDAARLLPRDLKRAVGSGALLLAEASAAHGRRIDAALPELQPSAAQLAEIALKARETVSILRPLYLRPPDARPQAPARLRR